jgi:phosphatidylserine decarboxylase
MYGKRTGQALEAARRWDTINLAPLGVLWAFGGWWRWLVLVLALGGAAAVPRSGPLAAALLAATAILVWAFRSPRRAPPAVEALVAPADGVVDDVERLSDSSLLPGRVARIGIFLSLLDVHAVRAPVTGSVARVRGIPGAHRSALALDSGDGNQRNEVWLRDAWGAEVGMRQIAGLVARRAVFAPGAGDRIRAGAIIGMIRFGSRVELYVPLADYRVGVEPGTRVRAGETVLGWRRFSAAGPERTRGIG